METADIEERDESPVGRFIDHIFYINLSTRADRRAQIETELDAFQLSYERFEAIPTPEFGIYGCGLSHLAVLKLAKERNYRNVLIVEDDFEFVVDKATFEEQIRTFFESGLAYDVCMLAYWLHEHTPIDHPVVNKVDFAQTAAGYIVNAHYYDALIELYEWGLPLLKSTGEHWNYGNDIIWRNHQKKDAWVYFKTRIGKQRASYSDNAKCFCDYGV